MTTIAAIPIGPQPAGAARPAAHPGTRQDTSQDTSQDTRPRIVSRALLLVFAASVGADASLYLLLTALPSTAAIGGGTGAAGAVTTALMLASVVGEVATPRLVARLGERCMFAAGLLLLGVAALALAVSGTGSLPAVLAASAVRGVGFGLTVVVGGALVASLAPKERRGEGLGLYGVVVGLPAIVGLPLGEWLAGAFGTQATLAVAAISALVVLPLLAGLPGGRGHREKRSRPGIGTALRAPALVRPALVFAASTAASGIVVTFLPLAVPMASSWLVAPALLAQNLASTAARWWAGARADRSDVTPPFVAGLLAVSGGIGVLVLASQPVGLLAAMVLFGAGFGILQAATMTTMFARVDADGFAAASALWNGVYDTGFGLGAAAFGLVAGMAGFGPAFGLTAAAVLLALVPAVRDRRALA